MPVPVVQVGVMRMRVHQWLVPVAMRVRLAAVPCEVVRVMVVRVVQVIVFVLQRLVGMFMRVALREVQPYPESHQRSGEPEDRVRAFPSSASASPAPKNGATEK